MKIAIPVDDNRRDTGVCVSFGRAPYFLILDGETLEFVANPGAEAEGGAGIVAAQAVVDSGATTLLTVRCGQNAADVLQEAEISIYKTIKATALENAKALEAGTLDEMTQFHAGFHGIQ